MSQPAATVEMVPIDTLVPDPENLKRHDARDIAVIRASLKAFGQRTAIVVQRESRVVSKGNGTLAAAKELGWDSIAVSWADDDEATARAYALADNRSSEYAEWDRPRVNELAAELAAIPELDLPDFSFSDDELEAFRVDPAELDDHPRNYREHPDEQVSHIAASLKAFGVYRNVVVSKDNVILAGHGVVKAARAIGLEKIPVRRVDLHSDDPAALKILAGDNELGRFAEQDDRALTEMLKEIADFTDDGLVGTGYDSAMLANLVFTTRTASEIANRNEASEWAGMPSYEPGDDKPKLVLAFDDPADRDELIEQLGIIVSKKLRGTWSAPYPPREKEALAANRFVGGES